MDRLSSPKKNPPLNEEEDDEDDYLATAKSKNKSRLKTSSTNTRVASPLRNMSKPKEEDEDALMYVGSFKMDLNQELTWDVDDDEDSSDEDNEVLKAKRLSNKAAGLEVGPTVSVPVDGKIQLWKQAVNRMNSSNDEDDVETPKTSPKSPKRAISSPISIKSRANNSSLSNSPSLSSFGSPSTKSSSYSKNLFKSS